jgi:orotate phosphoribosyltransferase
LMARHDADKAALAEALFRVGALRFGKFTLSSGKPSSYYLDLRVIPSYPEVYEMVVESYRALAGTIGLGSFDAVAGVATAGVTVSSPLALLLRKPMVYVRREEKGHGLGRRVEGEVHPGWRALVVDDLVTTGGSILAAVEALRKAGVVVEEAEVLVDRLEGGKANLGRAGVRLSSVADVEELVDVLYRGRKVPKRDYEAVMKQVRGAGG